MSERSVDLHSLTPAQARAIDMLAMGRSVAEAAEWAGVHRVTVSRWRNQHPAFIAELNSRMAETMESNATKVRRIQEIVLDTIIRRLEEGDREMLDLIIRRTRLLDANMGPVGPQDPEDVVQERVDLRMRQLADEGADGVALEAVGDLEGIAEAPDRTSVRAEIVEAMVVSLSRDDADEHP